MTRRLFSTHSATDGAELGDGYCSNQSLNIRKIKHRSYSVQSSYKSPFAKPLFSSLDALGLKSRIAYRNKLRKDRNTSSGSKRFVNINRWKTSAPRSNNGLIGSVLGLPIAMSIFSSSSSNQCSNPDMLSIISLPSPKPALQYTSVSAAYSRECLVKKVEIQGSVGAISLTQCPFYH